jgi:hypothetical protein
MRRLLRRRDPGPPLQRTLLRLPAADPGLRLSFVSSSTFLCKASCLSREACYGGLQMKKLTRIACLATALVLSSFAMADAWPFYGYVNCYYTCTNGETVRMDTWEGQCCGTQFLLPDGNNCYALWWEQMGITDVCMI